MPTFLPQNFPKYSTNRCPTKVPTTIDHHVSELNILFIRPRSIMLALKQAASIKVGTHSWGFEHSWLSYFGPPFTSNTCLEHPTV